MGIFDFGKPKIGNETQLNAVGDLNTKNEKKKKETKVERVARLEAEKEYKEKLLEILSSPVDFDDVLNFDKDARTNSVEINYQDPEIVHKFNKSLSYWFSVFRSGRSVVDFAKQKNIPLEMKEKKDEEGKVLCRGVDLTSALALSLNRGWDNTDSFREVVKFAEENDLKVNYNDKAVVDAMKKELEHAVVMGQDEKILEMLDLSDKHSIVSREDENKILHEGFIMIGQNGMTRRFGSIYEVMKKRKSEIDYRLMIEETVEEILARGYSNNIEFFEKIVEEQNAKIDFTDSKFVHACYNGIENIIDSRMVDGVTMIKNIIEFAKKNHLDGVIEQPGAIIEAEDGQEKLNLKNIITDGWRSMIKNKFENHGMGDEFDFSELSEVLRDNGIDIDFQKLYEYEVDVSLDVFGEEGSNQNYWLRSGAMSVRRKYNEIFKIVGKTDPDVVVTDEKVIEKAIIIAGKDLQDAFQLIKDHDITDHMREEEKKQNLDNFFYNVERYSKEYKNRFGIDIEQRTGEVYESVLINFLIKDPDHALEYLEVIGSEVDLIDFEKKEVEDAFAHGVMRGFESGVDFRALRNDNNLYDFNGDFFVGENANEKFEKYEKGMVVSDLSTKLQDYYEKRTGKSINYEDEGARYIEKQIGRFSNRHKEERYRKKEFNGSDRSSKLSIYLEIENIDQFFDMLEDQELDLSGKETAYVFMYTLLNLFNSSDAQNNIIYIKKLYELIKKYSVEVDFNDSEIRKVLRNYIISSVYSVQSEVFSLVIGIIKEQNIDLNVDTHITESLYNLKERNIMSIWSSVEMINKSGYKYPMENEKINGIMNDCIELQIDRDDGDLQRLIEFIDKTIAFGVTVEFERPCFNRLFSQVLSFVRPMFDSHFNEFMKRCEKYYDYIIENGIQFDFKEHLQVKLTHRMIEEIDSSSRGIVDPIHLKDDFDTMKGKVFELGKIFNIEINDELLNKVNNEVYSTMLGMIISGKIDKTEENELEVSPVELLKNYEKITKIMDKETDKRGEKDEGNRAHFGAIEISEEMNFDLAVDHLIIKQDYENAVELYKYAKKKGVEIDFTQNYINACHVFMFDNEDKKVEIHLKEYDEMKEHVNSVVFDRLSADIEFGKKYNLTYREMTRLVTEGRSVVFERLEEVSGKEALFDRFIEDLVEDGEWNSDVVANFEELRKSIGFSSALNYIGTYDRHDALQINQHLDKFLDLGHLTEDGDLSENKKQKLLSKRRKVLKTVLSQTAKDTSMDENYRDSRQGLIDVLNLYNPAWFDEFEEKGYFDNVKTFRKQVKMKGKMTPEVKAELKRVEKENPALHKYVKKLLDHPTVSGTVALEFMQHPEVYFERTANFASESRHERYKASNFYELGDGADVTIDLGAEDVRDSIVNGNIDKLCPFKPFKFEQSYFVADKVSKRQMKYKQLLENIQNDLDGVAMEHLKDRKALMSKEMKEEMDLFMVFEFIDTDDLMEYTKTFVERLQKKSKGKEKIEDHEFETVSDRESLITLWKKILHNIDAPWKDINYMVRGGKMKLNGMESVKQIKDISSWPEKHRRELTSRFIDMVKGKIKLKELIITTEVLSHDDPRYATVGDDTNSCMPFIDGKHGAGYMVLPSCSALSVSFRTPDQDESEARIALQSVLMKDKHLQGMSFSKIRTDKLRPGQMIKRLGEDFIEKFYSSPEVLACDNIEGHQNLVQHLISSDEKQIEKIYRGFFRAYAEHMKGFKGDKVIIGDNYTEYLKHLKRVENEFFMKANASYNDNRSETSFELLEEDEQKKVASHSGVEEISWEDTLPCAYLQEKAYTKGDHRDGENVNDIADTQNILIASHIQAEKEGTTKLTIGHFDEKTGNLDGYALGFIVRDHSDGEKRKIYSHETVVDPEAQGKGVGRELFTNFMMKIMGDPKLSKMSIVTNLREVTSYKMIMNRKEEFRQWGYEVIERKKEEVMGENFYQVEFVPIKK